MSSGTLPRLPALFHRAVFCRCYSSIVAAFTAKTAALAAIDPAEIIAKCDQAVEQTSTFQCVLFDEIRRVPRKVFRNTLANGSVERAMVISDTPIRLRIQNSEGEWLIDQSEAIKLEYGTPSPSVLQDIRRLMVRFPNQINITDAGVESVEGADCYKIVAILSDNVVKTLASEFRAANKDSRFFKEDPSTDTLQFVAKKRIYWIRVQDLLLCRHKSYDGNGDLMEAVTSRDIVTGVLIPHIVFEVPDGWPIFVAHSPADLTKHRPPIPAGRERYAWGKLSGTISGAFTNTTRVMGAPVEGKANETNATGAAHENQQ